MKTSLGRWGLSVQYEDYFRMTCGFPDFQWLFWGVLPWLFRVVPPRGYLCQTFNNILLHQTQNNVNNYTSYNRNYAMPSNHIIIDTQHSKCHYAHYLCRKTNKILRVSVPTTSPLIHTTKQNSKKWNNNFPQNNLVNILTGCVAIHNK